MRYGAFSPEDLPYVRNVEEPIPEDLGACDADVIELGRPWRARWLRTEHRGEQARDKLMEKRERGRSSNINKGVSGPREFVNRALPVIRRIVIFFLFCFRTCIRMWKVTG